jgi:hypothetical protein
MMDASKLTSAQECQGKHWKTHKSGAHTFYILADLRSKPG